MASILRQIVAGPRAQHPEAGMDLCYVTDNIIATSGPSGTYPQLAYRTPLSDLVAFLDKKHGENWAIWEFRAEGTGYPDSEVYNRINHYPWPDHHPPPFAIIPLIMASMRNWLKEKKERVVVVHCKAGKGRSGSVSCSYLISEEGWKAEDALRRFTERRMRYGAGVSIPSQLRWISYVDRWTHHNKIYLERPVEILEIHIWGLRDGVKVSIEGYVDEGKTIKNFHTFNKKEREIVRGDYKTTSAFADVVSEAMKMTNSTKQPSNLEPQDAENITKEESAKAASGPTNDNLHNATGDVIFRPTEPIILPTSDVNIDFERRNKAPYGLSMLTAVAHVWFNVFFEGNGPENSSATPAQPPRDSGVFEINWEAMDGIKGSLKKGTKGFDKLAVVWKCQKDEHHRGRRSSVVVKEPPPGEAVPETGPADWRGHDYNNPSPGQGRTLGLRAESPESKDISRASSVRHADDDSDAVGSDTEAVKPFIKGEDGSKKNSLDEDGKARRSVEKEHVKRLLPLSSDLPGPTHKFADEV